CSGRRGARHRCRRRWRPARSDDPRPYNRPMPTILVIDDNPAVGAALEVLFSLHDIATLHADSPRAGLEMLAGEDVDLVIQDMNFSADTTSGAEGEALFARI